MNDEHRCRCGSLEIQRLREESRNANKGVEINAKINRSMADQINALREANAVLMEAVEHYADNNKWDLYT